MAVFMARGNPKAPGGFFVTVPREADRAAEGTERGGARSGLCGSLSKVETDKFF